MRLQEADKRKSQVNLVLMEPEVYTIGGREHKTMKTKFGPIMNISSEGERKLHQITIFKKLSSTSKSPK